MAVAVSHPLSNDSVVGRTIPLLTSAVLIALCIRWFFDPASEIWFRGTSLATGLVSLRVIVGAGRNLILGERGPRAASGDRRENLGIVVRALCEYMVFMVLVVLTYVATIYVDTLANSLLERMIWAAVALAGGLLALAVARTLIWRYKQPADTE